MADSDAKTAGRGRKEARRAILQATREELARNGWRKFSVDTVARAAQASKQTIYRNWPQTSVMCVEAALNLIEPQEPRGRTAEERIAALLRPFEQAMRTSHDRVVLRGALLAAGDDDEAGSVMRHWMRETIRAPLRIILAELSAKHAVRRDYQLDAAVDLALASVWHNVIVMNAPLRDDFSLSQARMLLKQLAPDQKP